MVNEVRLPRLGIHAEPDVQNSTPPPACA